jgi:uncharacterized repeat protein (TIGR01451 family)
MKRLFAILGVAVLTFVVAAPAGAAGLSGGPSGHAQLPPALQQLLSWAPSPAPLGNDPAPAPAPTPGAESPEVPGAPPLSVVPGTDPAPGSGAPPPSPAPAPAAKRAGLAPLAATNTGPFLGLADGGHAGYASGTVIHADALQSAATRLADIEVAFSGAAYTSAPLGKGIQNEVQRVVTYALGAFNGYGRGSGLEVGLGVSPSGENQIVLPGKVEAKAPPNTKLITEEEGPIKADPLANVSLLRGQAQGRAVTNGCVLGSDLGYGLGYVTDLGLINTPSTPLLSTSAENPERAASQSVSRTRLVRAGGSTGPISKFGLMSETRQTIAPVTFFAGTPNAFTIEVAGEWVLRATADGTTGSVHYGPGTASPETPIVRIIDSAKKVTNVLTFQQLLGKEGLHVAIPNGVAEIAIGEAARALGGAHGTKPTATGTLASAAVDVVRVKLLEQGQTHAADVRIGHMEAAVAVPEGGITCGIGMAKRADPESVRAGQSFTWTVTVANPHECTLTKVKVVDTITTSNPGIKYTITGHSPTASSTTPDSLTWDDIGPIGPGQSKELKITVKVAEDSTAGLFTDTAAATALCGEGSAEGAAEATGGAAAGNVLEGRVVLNLPEVVAVLGRSLPAALPRTGGLSGRLLPALGLMGAGFALHKLSRREPF